jgi:hypothetical protein
MLLQFGLIEPQGLAQQFRGGPLNGMDGRYRGVVELSPPDGFTERRFARWGKVNSYEDVLQVFHGGILPVALN